MNSNVKRAVLAGLVSASMLGGGVIGATMFRATSVFAASDSGIPSNVRAAPSPGASAAPGSFKSNEDPAHEATESAAREAQEDAGQKPTVP